MAWNPRGRFQPSHIACLSLFPSLHLCLSYWDWAGAVSPACGVGKRDIQVDQLGFCAVPYWVGTQGPTLDLCLHQVLSQAPFSQPAFYSPRYARLYGCLCPPIRGLVSIFSSLLPAWSLLGSVTRRTAPEVRLGGRCGCFTVEQSWLTGLCTLPSFCAAQRGASLPPSLPPLARGPVPLAQAEWPKYELSQTWLWHPEFSLASSPGPSC